MYMEEKQQELCEKLEKVISVLPSLYEEGTLKTEVLKDIVEEYLIATSFNRENFDYEKYGNVLLELLKKPINLTEVERNVYFAYNNASDILLNDQNVLAEFLKLYNIRKSIVGEMVRTETMKIKNTALANVFGIREIESPVLEKKIG